jgi:16S rRNA (cytidine1402-2'-O)-methyltransferase
LLGAPAPAAATLKDLVTACGPDRRAALCRELTKLHEEIWRGSLEELTARATDAAPRGEVTIVVAGHERAEAEATMGLDEGRSEVDRLVGQGWSRSMAAREVAQRTHLPRRELFRE